MEMKKCPYCGEDILAVAKKCKYCGEWLEEKKQDSAAPQKAVCPVCAEEIDPETAVCPYCHEHIGEQKETAVPVASATDTPKKILETEAEPKHSSKGFFATCFFDTLRRHYADFRGAESRKSYWCFILCEMAAILGTSFLGMLFGTGIFICFYLIISLALCIPTLAITVRRLHDIGKTGWWILISMIPLAGPVWLLVLLSKKGTAQVPVTKWTVPDSLYLGVLALVVAVGIIRSVADNEKYYVYEEPEWVGNIDLSRFFAVATTDRRDIAAEGYVDRHGTQLIVATELPPYLVAAEEVPVRAVLSSKEIVARNPGVGTDLNYEIFPSTIDPDLVYFNYWENGMEFPSCGKVNYKTGEFDLFNGTIIGMISDGKFDECYLRVDLGISGVSEGVKIYPQSAVGQSASPMAVFDIAQYWRGHSNEELILDKTFAERVIEWLENGE